MRPLATHMFFLGLTTVMFAVTGSAQPVFGSSFILNGQTIFPDKKKANLFYYLPPDYKLLTDGMGKPSFSMVKMRYIGKTSTEDAGVARYNNILQFKVGIDLQQQRSVSDTRVALRKKYPGAELQSMPVRKFLSLLVFAPSTPVTSNDTLSVVRANFSEASDEHADVNNSYWTARTITIRLSDIDAQLVESALETGNSIMSFSYAIYSSFAERTDLRTTIYNNPVLRDQVKAVFDKEMNGDTASAITLIRADAFPLSVDVKKWPSIIQEVDINERLPAKYPLFDVYCYDFSDGLRADLYEKKIEIKGSGVSGTDVLYRFSFREDMPQVYAKAIRFAYAVRFDKPFYYRVSEIDHDGNMVTTDWLQKDEGGALIDITSSPDKIIVKPKEQEQ